MHLISSIFTSVISSIIALRIRNVVLTFELLQTVCVLHIKLAAFDGCNIASPALHYLSFFCLFHFVQFFFLHHVANELSLSQQPYSAALFNLPSSETEKCINSILIRKLAGNMQLTLIATRNETDSLQKRERVKGKGVSHAISRRCDNKLRVQHAPLSTWCWCWCCLPPCDTRKSFGDTSKDYANCCGSSSAPAPAPAAGWGHWL